MSAFATPLPVRLDKIAAYEKARKRELVDLPYAHHTSDDVQIEVNLITARTHLMVLAARLAEHYREVARLATGMGEAPEFEMSYLYTPAAYTLNGDEVEVKDAARVPEFEQWVLGDDGATHAWDGFYSEHHDNEIDLATVLADVDALPAPDGPETEHVILVAIEVMGRGRYEAHDVAMSMLDDARKRLPEGREVSWWVAEDDRLDGSDCDSAVFVKAPQPTS